MAWIENGGVMAGEEDDSHIEVTYRRKEEEISYRGALSHLPEVLDRFGFERRPSPQEEAPQVPPATVDDQDDDRALREGLRHLWRGLQPRAKPIVKALATHAPAVGFETMQDEMGLSGQEIGGRLSSLGHQLRRVRGMGYDLPDVIQRDYNGRRYLIHREAAAIILQMAEAEA